MILATATVAHADPEPATGLDPAVVEAPAKPIKRRMRVPLVLGESLVVLLAPTAYYWSTTSVQREDWELRWDWPSWRMKLTSFDALILDTGNWQSNAIRHPLSGALTYQVGRANGFGMFASTAIDLAGSAVWEYVVEFKEKVSVNDLIVNTMSGFLIGEPLFQIGSIADHPGASWPRRALGAVVSPVNRLHAAAGYGSWRDPSTPRTRFELAAGLGIARHGADLREEARATLDLELVRSSAGSGRRGGTVRTLGGMWNRLAVDVRAGTSGFTALAVRTQTTYGGEYVRAVDDDGRGAERFLGAGGGVDYDTRQLAGPTEWDRLAVFHLIGPRLAFGRWSDAGHLIWEIGGYGDLAMVQAHVFGATPFPPAMPQTSVLRVRGYYYATGVTLATRLRVLASGWTAELDARAHQMWSIDGFDRVEMDGGPDDPHDVIDQRLIARGALGRWIGDAEYNTRLEVSIEAALRRGTWTTLERHTSEVDAGAAVVIGF